MNGVLWMIAGPSLVAYAAPTTVLSNATAPAPVTIVITHLPSPTSAIKLNFYNSSGTFLQAGQAALHQTVLPSGQRQAQVQVALPTGDWAVALSQDLNNNGKMDRNFLGIPSEPYAFSNNVRPHFSAPKFDECKFQVTGQAETITISFPK
ncbi:DUF2141 domain-containing protein [Hymenobacter sp. HMF4947]|uniref:DUF2141 domain-containing protein n=1 Tax=Hymenobacter ginkgonis TaxID=2682976 RepID=A0A7K1T8R3_9BACT|nr:DUF2141 domain-containing protein [Hymenobacter ginkgonis]MVN74788.1 DUF2141 domain-containing protein [Hymenobacter ginkgonis]